MSWKMERMPQPTDRAKANMETVVEETCKSLPRGGDHAVRAFIADRLADAAMIGRDTYGELGIVARKALADSGLSRRQRTGRSHRR